MEDIHARIGAESPPFASEAAEWFLLPEAIKNLVAAQQAVREHYRSITHGRLEFTLDGNLVGDIGAALAIEEFGLELRERNGEGIDGIAGGRTVQVKATGTGRGPAFRQTRVEAEHLLFLQIDFPSCRARVVYNGQKLPSAACPASNGLVRKACRCARWSFWIGV